MLRKGLLCLKASVPQENDFYDNESSRFQHTEMSEAVSGQSEIRFIAVLCFVNWSSHMVYGNVELLHYSALTNSIGYYVKTKAERLRNIDCF